MWEQLMSMITESGQQSVIENPEVPNEHNEAVIAEAKDAIASKLGDLAASGQTQQVQEMLDTPDHPEARSIQSNFATNIMEKFGINQQAAAGIAASLIPTVLNAIRGNANNNAAGNAGGGFNIQDILQSLGGGGNLQSTLSGIGAKLGLDKDGDGDVDLGDLTKMFK
ncbi:hypothetical protein [Chitinophaga tropicalis]|uniref:EF-hand domain-containing protein n=1 Tax=Chitinophaga tropicalis TaxID=2683588 RepID=A0A7K1UDW0_9BACT|nr:hypothetical protein [Chitinophaga tropicalis]MVT12185.1 hypothetical protein [Chitinophaga tropicalis]